MFSKNTYLQLPQVSSSSSSSLYPRPTNGTGPLVDLNGVEILLHHHHHHHPDMFSGHHYAPPPVEAAALLNQGGTGDGDHHHHHHHHHCPSSSSVQRRKAAAAAATVKKDRHSKIFTSQGPRDRRVRLSIGIARKFFDLQEVLGFDKPSKTLDWLLTKSRAAIKELMQYSKQNITTSNSLSSPSPSQGNIGNTNTSDEQKHIINSSLMADDSNRAAKVNDPSKESRAKARARARERTREKMSIKHLNNMGASTSNNLRGSAGFRDPIVPHGHGAYEQGGQDLIQESIMIKRKLKNPSFFGFQQNVILSRDLSSNYIVPSANANENNWDICAILDHHKFINSNSNI